MLPATPKIRLIVSVVLLNLLVLFAHVCTVRAVESINIPDFFPQYKITVNNDPMDGCIYLSGQIQGSSISFHCIMTNDGQLLYYQIEHELSIFGFHPYPDRQQMSFFKFGDRCWYLQDLNFDIVDTLRVNGDFRTDSHELYFDADGHAWMIGQEDVLVDMSETVDGGHPEAIVIGMVIQELDENGEILFEWHSLDHIPILDTDREEVDLTEEVIDYMHSNSIYVDTDGNVIVSSRNLNEVTKIDYETGEIIWRLGAGHGNMFTFVDDDPNEGFNLQHFAHRLENDNLLVFDNGKLHDPPVASAKEYELDEENLIATRVWSYEQDPWSMSFAMGSASRLENGNTIICWGVPDPDDPLIASEVTPEGETAWEIEFTEVDDRKVHCYRAYRTEMTGIAAKPYLTYEIREDSLLFYMNHFGADSLSGYQLFLDTHPEPTEFYGEYETGKIVLTDLEPGRYYFARIKSIQDNQTSDYSNRVQFRYSGTPVEEQTPPAYSEQHNKLGIWPNPANPQSTIQIDISQPSYIKLSVVNLLGREVDTIYAGQLLAGNHSFVFNGKQLANGIYFVTAMCDQQLKTVEKVLLLQ